MPIKFPKFTVKISKDKTKVSVLVTKNINFQDAFGLGKYLATEGFITSEEMQAAKVEMKFAPGVVYTR